MTGSKTHVGKGVGKFKTLIPTINQPVSLKIDLNHTNKKQTLQKGIVMMGAIVSEVKGESNTNINKDGSNANMKNDTNNKDKKDDLNLKNNLNYSVPDDNKDKKVSSNSILKGYKVKLDKLQALDLVDTGSMLDGQDPMLTITIGKQSFSTER
jgi:hypothetical protein